MPSDPSRRRFPRKKTRHTVDLCFDDTTIEALMVDVSEGGVGLLLRDGDQVPDTFTVRMRSGETRTAEIVWRGYPRCGAIFRL